MKCNKCLKKIPKGEEIKMYCNGGDWGGHYSRKGSYGGCYCEDCWKTKDEYERYEGGGKKEKEVNPNTNSGTIPGWVWFITGMLVGMALLGLICWLWQSPKR